MTPQLVVIDSLRELIDLKDYLKDFEYISYDCETTGLTQQDQVIGFSVCAEEDKSFYVVLSEWDLSSNKLNTIDFPDYQELANDIIVSLKHKNLIMHNAIFDCMMAESFFKVRLIGSLHTDTMILAHLLNENRRVGLKDLASTMFGEDSTQEQKEMKESVLKNGGKLTKASYELYKADSKLLGKYGAKDALLTYKLFNTLVPELYEQNLDQFFYEDESMPLLRGPTYELNTTGLQVDTQKLTVLKKQLQAECMEAKAFIYQEIAAHVQEKYPGTTKANTFNIGASQQLAWLLFEKIGLEFSVLTAGGKKLCKSSGLKLPYTFSAKRDFLVFCRNAKNTVHEQEATVNGKTVRAKKVKDPWAYIACDKSTLQKLAPKYKWIERLLEYQRKMKILTTYIKGIEERIQYGVIRPSFLQHGTTSGRYSSRNPNFQNLPRDDKRIKGCIVSRPGKVFVGADYSQLEPRVFAYFSGDQRLKEAFESAEDFYSVIGMEVFDKTDCTPFKDGSDEAFGVKYKKLRDISKVIALSTTYGSTAFKLAPTIGKSVEDTQQVINDYFERFPGVAKMMTSSRNKAKTEGFVTNLFGRKRNLPEALLISKHYGKAEHADLPYEARNILNLAVNHVIQSTGASVVNRAAIKFHANCKELELNCKLVLQVHDSLVVECSPQDAETITLLLEDAMINTVLLEGVQLEAIPKIGKNLAEV